MAISYGTYSPYKNEMLTTVSDSNFEYLSYYDIPGYVPVQDDMEDYVIESKYNLKPWILAKELYGNERAYWVFAICNPTLKDPVYDFVTGITIKIPTSDQFEDIISSK